MKSARLTLPVRRLYISTRLGDMWVDDSAQDTGL